MWASDYRVAATPWKRRRHPLDTHTCGHGGNVQEGVSASALPSIPGGTPPQALELLLRFQGMNHHPGPAFVRAVTELACLQNHQLRDSDCVHACEMLALMGHWPGWANLRELIGRWTGFLIVSSPLSPLPPPLAPPSPGTVPDPRHHPGAHRPLQRRALPRAPATARALTRLPPPGHPPSDAPHAGPASINAALVSQRHTQTKKPSTSSASSRARFASRLRSDRDTGGAADPSGSSSRSTETSDDSSDGSSSERASDDSDDGGSKASGGGVSSSGGGGRGGGSKAPGRAAAAHGVRIFRDVKVPGRWPVVLSSGMEPGGSGKPSWAAQGILLLQPSDFRARPLLPPAPLSSHPLPPSTSDYYAHALAHAEASASAGSSRQPTAAVVSPAAAAAAARKLRPLGVADTRDTLAKPSRTPPAAPAPAPAAAAAHSHQHPWAAAGGGDSSAWDADSEFAEGQQAGGGSGAGVSPQASPRLERWASAARLAAAAAAAAAGGDESAARAGAVAAVRAMLRALDAKLEATGVDFDPVCAVQVLSSLAALRHYPTPAAWGALQQSLVKQQSSTSTQMWAVLQESAAMLQLPLGSELETALLMQL
ncbi:MAG: hypothetical protein WDW36_008232 [Sanguina aurantia]